MTLNKYNISDYASILEEAGLLISENLIEQYEETVQHLAYHSDDVQMDTLFVCKSADFKKDYLATAIRRGAIGYISEIEYGLKEDVPHLIVSDIRLAMALVAEQFYNSPQKKLTLIGIGGTKGKTTTAYYLKAILDEYLKAQGKPPAALISSIKTFDGIEEAASVNTTPEAIDLQRHLANAVEAGLEYAVMEVSSQALKYHRTAGLVFDVGIFLNIDEDHISPTEHTDFNDYLNSKMKMFDQTKQLLVNLETKERETVLGRAKQVNEYYTFSLVSEEADYYVSEIQSRGLENQFAVHSKRLKEMYNLSMPGEFNVSNALSAIAASDLLDIPQKYVKQALSHVNIPGRMSVFSTIDKNVIAVSDYAHNRLSFKTLIQSMQKIYPNYKIISIFGAPGEKALGRRKELGTVGGRYSDYVILTMDDPGNESAEDIAMEMAKYVEMEGTPYQIILNREKAIQEAFEMASDQTVILAIGKGHETTMKIKGKQVPIRSDDQIMHDIIKVYNGTLENNHAE